VTGLGDNGVSFWAPVCLAPPQGVAWGGKDGRVRVLALATGEEVAVMQVRCNLAKIGNHMVKVGRRLIDIRWDPGRDRG
jgi:hypothetical protein